MHKPERQNLKIAKETDYIVNEEKNAYIQI